MDAGGGAARRKGAIFVEDFFDVPLPLDTVRSRCTNAEAWVTDLASAAEEDGESLRLQIGPAWAAVA